MATNNQLDQLWLQLLVLIILITLNAFFAASEIAIISLNDQKIKKLMEEGDKKARLVYDLVREPSRFLATIQVGLTLAGLLASAVASQSFAAGLTRFLSGLGLPFSPSIINALSLLVITLILSFFTLVAGELVPKRLAMQNPEAIAWRAIKPLQWVARLAGPFIRLLSLATNLGIQMVGGDPARHEKVVTEEEIRLMVDMGQERGVIEKSEKEMINNIFEFNNTRVSQIMTHRTEIVGLPLCSPLSQAVELITKEKYSRVPVYDGSIDNIVGILHALDLIPFLKHDPRTFVLGDLIRKPYFVPAAKKTDDLLHELQKAQTHLAVIVDEFGGTAGIVTVEDLLEEIVGNIFDEHDLVHKEIETVAGDTYLVDGAISLDKVNDHFQLELPDNEYDTLSGFLIGQLGRIPQPPEQSVIEYAGFLFEVVAIDEKRIAKVRIHPVRQGAGPSH